MYQFALMVETWRDRTHCDAAIDRGGTAGARKGRDWERSRKPSQSRRYLPVGEGRTARADVWTPERRNPPPSPGRARCLTVVSREEEAVGDEGGIMSQS